MAPSLHAGSSGCAAIWVSPFLNLPFIMLNQATVVVTKDHSHTGTDIITLACPPAERSNGHVRERLRKSADCFHHRQRLWRTVGISLMGESH